MMKKLNLALICLLQIIACNYANAQAAGNYLYNNGYSFNNEKITISTNNANSNAVLLKAEVMMNVRATSYTAIFAIAQTGKDVYEVDSLMQLRISQIKYALAMLGVPNTDLHIDAVSMVPTYAYQLEEKKFNKRSVEVPTGFEMKKNIHVLFKNHDLLDRIISEMAFADVYDLVKVEYNIDGVQTYYDELRKAALSVITTKEATYTSLKMHLDVVSLADGFNTTYPMERYKSYTAFHSGSSPHEVRYALMSRENNVYVNGKNNLVRIDQGQNPDFLNQQFVVKTAEKNKTIFYDRVPYNQFDKVINADIEEPCIQLSYALNVTYSVMTEATYLAQKEALEQNKQAMAMAKLSKKQKRKLKH